MHSAALGARGTWKLAEALLHTSTRCETSLGSWPGRRRAPATCPSAHWRHQFGQIQRALTRQASTSASSSRWKTRASSDPYTRASKVAGLKSRAAFKLLEISDKHKLFRPGDTVVDLGYAPGSWSQVAVNRTRPGGRVLGIDVIPAQPPRGVSTIQGDFLSEGIREEVRRYVLDDARGRVRTRVSLARREEEDDEGASEATEADLEEEGKGLVEREREMDEEAALAAVDTQAEEREGVTQRELDRMEGRVVDVVLSDMCEPWPLVSSTWIRSVSNPYRRMMNTSGIAFRDHAGSMDLCNAALIFVYDTLATGGHFLCKFYQGAEDHAFEMRLKKLFGKVHRIKPDSSRKESREAYFVCLRRLAGVSRDKVFPDDNG